MIFIMTGSSPFAVPAFAPGKFQLVELVVERPLFPLLGEGDGDGSVFSLAVVEILFPAEVGNGPEKALALLGAREFIADGLDEPPGPAGR